MAKEDTLNDSDHRAVILHLGTETYLDMDTPRAVKTESNSESRP